MKRMTVNGDRYQCGQMEIVMNRIIKEVRGVNRVFYDLTSKHENKCLYGMKLAITGKNRGLQ